MADDPTDLAELRAELEALRSELAALRPTYADDPSPAAPETTPAEPTGAASHRPLTRRGLLAAAVAGGTGIVAASVASAAPAAATPGAALVVGQDNAGAGTVTSISGSAGYFRAVFAVANPSSTAETLCFYSQFDVQSGLVVGGNTAAVVGDSRDHNGVTGVSRNLVGVYGGSQNYFGVWGDTQQGPAVEGTSPDVGVRGIGENESGVIGMSTSGRGVTATASGTGEGVYAESARGYGVVATGGRAPLRLVPGAKTGAPTAGRHLLGEMFVDKLGVLYLCTVVGSPGTWKRVALA